MKETLVLFKKNIKKEDGTSFDTYFATNPEGISINVRLTDNAKIDVVRSGINFPIEVDIDDENYFIKSETKTDNNGVKFKVATCVILSLPTIRKANLEKYTLQDYFKAKENETKGL